MRSGSKLPIITGGGGGVLYATVYDKSDIKIRPTIIYRWNENNYSFNCLY